MASRGPRSQGSGPARPSPPAIEVWDLDGVQSRWRQLLEHHPPGIAAHHRRPGAAASRGTPRPVSPIPVAIIGAHADDVSAPYPNPQAHRRRNAPAPECGHDHRQMSTAAMRIAPPASGTFGTHRPKDDACYENDQSQEERDGGGIAHAHVAMDKGRAVG